MTMPHPIAYTKNIVKKSDETTSFTKLINCLRDIKIMKNTIKVCEIRCSSDLQKLTANEIIELVNNSSLNFDIKKLEKLRKEDAERRERNRPLRERKSNKMSAIQKVIDLKMHNFENVFTLIEFLKKEKDHPFEREEGFRMNDETKEFYRNLLDLYINELESFVKDRLSEKNVKFNMKDVSSHLDTVYEHIYQSDPDIHVEIDDTNNASESFWQQLTEMREKIAVKDELKECP